MGSRHGPGEVLRPGEPRRADGTGGAQGEGQTGTEAGKEIPGGRSHGRRLGVTEDGRDAPGRPAVTADVERPPGRTGQGAGEARTHVLPVRG